MKKPRILKRTALSLLLLLLTGSQAGCMGTPGKNASTTSSTSGDQTTSDSSQSTQSTQTDNETDFPGSYTVPEGWVKAESHSTQNKIFYVEEGHEDDRLPDNISIEVGTNRYSADEHETFRDAILQQLAMQLQSSDAEVTGDGTKTEQDYVVYIFTISDGDVVTKQYYIVGDQRYCLLQLTNFTGSESANDAAQDIVDSFVWN